jgi:hypothetical protein
LLTSALLLASNAETGVTFFPLHDPAAPAQDFAHSPAQHVATVEALDQTRRSVPNRKITVNTGEKIKKRGKPKSRREVRTHNYAVRSISSMKMMCFSAQPKRI